MKRVSNKFLVSAKGCAVYFFRGKQSVVYYRTPVVRTPYHVVDPRP